jgi:hypothetical protein
VPNKFVLWAAIALLTGCATATFHKAGSDARIEDLRAFHLAFVDQFAVTGKKFDEQLFEARVSEGNARFQQAITEEKFTARKPVLHDLAAQFQADAAHLRSKARQKKITPALRDEMKKDINKIYDHALARQTSS